MFSLPNLDGQFYYLLCHRENDDCIQEWDVKLKCVQTSNLPYQIKVSFDGCSYTAFIGRYVNGFYICIPSLFIGSDISELDDVLYNKCRLEKAGLSEREAISFSQALRTFGNALSNADFFRAVLEKAKKLDELEKQYSPLPV